MTKQEQIEEIQKIIDDSWEFSSISAELGSGDGDINVEEAAKALYGAGYRKIDDFEECRKCPAWSGTDCVRNPYTEGCLDDKVNLKNEIKRLEKENEQLKAKLEARLTCDFVRTAQTYAVQDFAEKLKAKLLAIFGKTICSDLDTEDITDIIDELLKEYKE